MKRGAFGKFFHERAITPIDKPEIVVVTRNLLVVTALAEAGVGLTLLLSPPLVARFSAF